MDEQGAVVARDLACAVEAVRVAADNDHRWPAALDAVSRYLRARFSVLVFEDSASALLELRHSTHAEKNWVSEYLRHHRRLDALKARVLENAEVGQGFVSRDFLASAQFQRSAIFQRWLAPHGLADVAGAVVHRSAQGACLLIACFEAEADAGVKDRIAVLAPIFAESVAGAPSTSRGGGELLAELFEALSAPVMIVDRDLRVRFINRAAKAALIGNDAVVVSDGALVVQDRLAREALEQALSAASEPRSAAIMLRHGESRCCVLHVSPLAGGAAALILRRVTADPLAGGDVAASLYGLTSRESSVLLSIAEVGGVPATARALGLSVGTVKSYLKNIFQKTGARRQADLVKLALLLETPFLAEARESEPV